MAKPLPRFVLVNAAFANRTIERDEGGYWMKISYDAGGRVVAAESSGPDEYTASLTIDVKRPSGSFRNSFGDVMSWCDGRESSDATFGPYEQTDTRSIDYDAWVTEMLLTMCARNAG